MLRITVFILLTFLAPFLIYALWQYSLRRIKKREQQNAYPWLRLLIAGTLLTLFMLTQIPGFLGSPPRSSYQPAQLGKDGSAVPGSVHVTTAMTPALDESGYACYNSTQC